MNERCGLYVYEGLYVWVYGGRSVTPSNETVVRYLVLSLSEPARHGKTETCTPEEFINSFDRIHDCSDFTGYENTPAKRGTT